MSFSRRQRKTAAVFSLGHRWLLLLCAVACAICAPPSNAYVLIGGKWADGDVTLHLGLAGGFSLQDGSPSFNDSAADALTTWNLYMHRIRFVGADAYNPAPADGVNSVAFASKVFGDDFGSNTLAVTTYYSAGPHIFDERDVLFNNAVRWDSYRGAIQGSGPTGLYDLHRVALHEFGHVLGLDHPDEHGQPGRTAIMNSIISNLDHLADDDIAGARALYPGSITSSLFQLSVEVGNPFQYQIAANIGQTSYSAVGMPAGLTVDANSGVISGTPTQTGSFQITITATRDWDSVSAVLPLVVRPRQITSSVFLNTRSGDPFTYKITADNMPTSFNATNLPPGLQLDTTTGVISGTPRTSGVFMIDLSALGNFGAATAQLRLTVNPLPLTSSTAPVTFLIGDFFTYQITAGNNPVTYSATGLPAGLTLDPNTGLITGRPTVSGTFNVVLRATSAVSEAGATLTITVQPPRITNPTVPEASIGIPYNYGFVATHPATFSATNLPPGLTIDTSGVISGTPTTIGSFFPQITAHTAFGDAFATPFINVLGPRIIVSPSYSTPIGSAASVQVIVSHPASSFTASNLPTGLVIDPSTGVISGVPTLSGFYTVLVSAQTAFGTAKGSIAINVMPVPVVTTTATPIASVASINLGAGTMLVDDQRQRLYYAVGSKIHVIDTNSFAIIGTIQLEANAGSLAFSRDRSKLWSAPGQSYYIAQVDLETLTFVRSLTPAAPVTTLREGDGNRLYVNNGYGQIVQLDATTGALQQTLFNTTGSAYLNISPDAQTLYVGDGSRIARVDISSPTAVVQSPQLTNVPDAQDIVVSHDGKTLCLTGPSLAGRLLSASNLTFLGALTSASAGTPIAFAPDDSRIYAQGSGIRVYEAGTLKQIEWLAPDGNSFGAMVVAPSNKHLFMMTGTGVRVYPVIDPPAPPSSPAPHSLVNVSTRLRALTADDVPIGGFIIEGTAPKKVVVRAIGPSLKNFGVSGALADPMIELHAGDGSVVASNDNWNAQRQEVISSGKWPTDEHEAAVVATLNPGSYTAIVRGLNNTTGIALVEVYDIDPASSSRITNLSTRGKVETGDNVMIGGFIIAGDQPTQVLVRATGPSLTQYGVAGALDDSTLDLFDGNGAKLASNDDWMSDQPNDIMASGHAPSDPREAAIARTLAPGSYTAIVRGKNNSTGVALVEIYNLEPPAN